VITKETVHQKREDIRRIAADHGAVNVRVFGSVARGEAKHDSDLDLLVDVGPSTSSWFPAGLILDLENLLDCRVDVVTEKALNADLRDRVHSEAISI